MTLEQAPRAAAPPRRWWRWTLWAVRLVPTIALLSVVPDFMAFLLGEPGAAAVLAKQANEALGTMALLTLAGTLAIGPLGTVTGWRWHLILGRDLGLWTFALAMVDLIIAMITAPEGWLGGVAGTAFVAAGAAAALVMVPLAVTSNRYSMQLLGRFWKVLHRLVFAVLALVAVHLVLLAGAQALLPMVVLFGPTLALRIPAVRRVVVKWRKRRSAAKC